MIEISLINLIIRNLVFPRFNDDYMKQFWDLVNGEDNSLHRQGKIVFNPYSQKAKS